MKTFLSSFPKVLAILLLFLSLSGCTVTGFIIGDAVDSQKAWTNYTWTNNSLDQPIERGNLIEVYTKDGRITKGKFLGIEKNKFNDPYELLSIKKDGEKLSLDLQKIEKVEVLAQKKNAKFIGLALGALVDVIIVYSAISNMSFSLSWE